MLQNLLIQDFILIERLDLDFEDGFCVITGETGAGKSVLLDAIIFALGGKADGDVVRYGQDKAVVSVTFSATSEISCYIRNHYISGQYVSDVNQSNDSDSALELDVDDELIIKRVQYGNGRKKFFINDSLVTQKIVSDLFTYLLEIYGQHNHTLLLNSSSHLDILDQFADNYDLRDEVASFYKTWKNLEKEASIIESEKENLIKEIDYLTHICQEFDEIDPKESEEEELSEIKRRAQTTEKELRLIDSISKDIENSNFGHLIVKSQKNIAKSENVNLYDKLSIYLEDIYNKIEEAKSELGIIMQNFDSSDYSLADIEDRLYTIKSLARKHGCHSSELATFMKNNREKLSTLKNKLEHSKNLKEQVINAKSIYLSKAKLLSENRLSSSKDLEEKTMRELSLLEMNKAIFTIEIDQDEHSSSAKGFDRARFLASTNPGMPKAPIDKIASGGELSRFMLAFRAAFFDKSLKQTIIFDEIDVGISGSVADSIGQRLKALSKFAQVIVITHQPQVAGKADQHLLVHKTQNAIDTKVEVKNLDMEGRKLEIARMISGKEITQKALDAAKELIS